jgi:putative transcriptional regulator
MRTEHHIRKSTLLDYAAGRLSATLSVVAASHLAWCRECRKAVEAAAGTTREGPQELREGARPLDMARPGQTALKAMDRLPAAAEIAAGDMSDFGLPMPLALRLDGRGLEDLAWRKVLPGVAVRELELPPGGAGQLRLVRIAPGRALPEHGHGGGELSLVLRGAYRDQHGRYTIGDIADLDGTAVHRPVAEDAGPCICFVAAETPTLYRSWSGRMWQRLIGL